MDPILRNFNILELQGEAEELCASLDVLRGPQIPVWVANWREHHTPDWEEPSSWACKSGALPQQRGVSWCDPRTGGHGGDGQNHVLSIRRSAQAGPCTRSPSKSQCCFTCKEVPLKTTAPESKSGTRMGPLSLTSWWRNLPSSASRAFFTCVLWPTWSTQLAMDYSPLSFRSGSLSLMKILLLVIVTNHFYNCHSHNIFDNRFIMDRHLYLILIYLKGLWHDIFTSECFQHSTPQDHWYVGQNYFWILYRLFAEIFDSKSLSPCYINSVFEPGSPGRGLGWVECEKAEVKIFFHCAFK